MPATITASPDEPELVPLIDAAAYLSLDRQTLRRWVREGKLTAYKVGTRVRLDMREVRALVAPAPPERATE